ncbi:MAG: HlyD family secretion protein [Propionivibrio sp.]
MSQPENTLETPLLDAAGRPAPVGQTVRRRRRRFILLVVVPLIAALAIGIFWLRGGRYVETENAYVKADKLPVSAEVAGTIRDVLVRENEKVEAGQLLFRIDAAPFVVAVAKAEAELAQVRTNLAALQASYREKQSEIALARTKYKFALRAQDRQAGLVAKNFVSASSFDDVKQSSDLASQQIVVIEDDLLRIAASLGGSVDAPVEQHPSYRAALAELDQAKLDRQHAEVRAPLAAVVSKLPKPGQYVSAGGTALALVASGNVWVEANFTETDLTYVHPGQPVEITVDTYPDAVWHGEVDSLAPATGAEFSLIPAQNATGNWVKIAQRVPVRIRINREGGLPTLRAGLSAVVDIDTGHRRRVFGISF